jgi:hypothetical protein
LNSYNAHSKALGDVSIDAQAYLVNENQGTFYEPRKIKIK